MSHTARDGVLTYSANQKEHHQVKSFREELTELLEEAGVEYGRKTWIETTGSRDDAGIPPGCGGGVTWSGGVGRRKLPQPPANCCKASGLIGGAVPPTEDVRGDEDLEDPAPAGLKWRITFSDHSGFDLAPKRIIFVDPAEPESPPPQRVKLL